MKTKFSGFLTLFLAFVVHLSFAQEKTITGVVNDQNGLPLPGTTVLIKGTTNGTSTDFDGKYAIKANQGATLVYSFVGYTSKEVRVGASNTINVTLAEDAEALDEVLIVGYGTATKQSFAGTAASISTENLEAKNFTNVTQALAGEVAGVTVINTSGQPGTVATVRVRGYGSPLGNRAPLYVIDGVPFSGTFELNSINPADIKSTTVLKDATATAIYGSRGANGVILITTKTGSSTEKGSIEIDVKSGINAQIIPRYDVIGSPEQYVGLVWEGLFNRGVVTGDADPVNFANTTLLGDNGIGDGYNMWNVATGAELIDPATRTVRNGVNRLFTPERYADEAFGTGFRREANIRFSGGSDKTRYMAALGYLDDQGYSINSDFKRYSARINLNSDVKEWLTIGGNLNYANSITTNNGQIVGSENLFEFADKMAPIYPVFARYPNSGELIPDPIYGGFQYDYGTPTGGTTPDPARAFTRSRPNANLLNPVGSAILDFNGSDTHAFNGNLNMNLKVTEDLNLEVTYGGQYSLFRRDNQSNHVYGTGANNNGNLIRTDRVRWSQTFLQLLRYKKSFGLHNLEALAAHETFESSFTESEQYKQNIILPGVANLSNYLEEQQPSFGIENAAGLESYFAQVNYNYDDKYFLTGSIRTDGSSRFINDQWGTFGSVGAAWVVSQEDFMADSFLSFLKLKASYGITGDQQGVSTTRAFSTFNTVLVGGGLAINERTVGNADLTWETSRMFQAGVELSVGSFLDVNIDYYRKFTDNLFFDQRVDSSAGFAFTRVNEGEILNAGLEFDITGRIINTKDYKLNVSVNGEVLHNEFFALPINPSNGLERIIDTGSSEDGAYGFAVGRSMFDFWMREYAGVDPADGAPMWYQYYDDINNNGVLDPDEGTFLVDDGNGQNLNTSGSLFEYRQLNDEANIQRTITKEWGQATQVFIDKSFIPDLRGAFRIGGQIKNFDFSTQFTYSLGGWAYDGQYAELMSDRFGAAGNNYHTDILRRWQNPGDITDVPLLSDNAIINSTSQSTRFIISTDHIALNNARIGYTLPSDFASKAGLSAVNLWVSGDNIFIKSARDGFNPSVREVGSSARRIYAPATTITLGARVRF